MTTHWVFKTTRIFYPTVLRSDVWNGSCWAEIKSSAGLVPPEDAGGCVFLPSPFSTSFTRGPTLLQSLHPPSHFLWFWPSRLLLSTLKDPCGHIHCGHIELTQIIKENLLVSRSLIYLIFCHGRQHIHWSGDDYVDIVQGEGAFFSSPQASSEEHLLQCHNMSLRVSIWSLVSRPGCDKVLIIVIAIA